MTNDNNIDKTRSLEQLLSELKDDIHLSFDSIVAYAKDELSQESKTKVASHIMGCQKCRQALDIAKKSIEAEEELDSLDQSASTVPMSADLKAKAILVARINSKRDEIAEKIAKKLLPERCWGRISFSITNIREDMAKEGQVEYETSDQPSELAIAAFASGAAVSDENIYEIIEQVVCFTNGLCDLLIKKCSGLGDLEKQLSLCCKQLLEQFSIVKFDEATLSVIQDIVKESIIGNEV